MHAAPVRETECHDVRLAITLEREQRQRDAVHRLGLADADHRNELARRRWRLGHRSDPLSRADDPAPPAVPAAPGPTHEPELAPSGLAAAAPRGVPAPPP